VGEDAKKGGEKWKSASGSKEITKEHGVRKRKGSRKMRKGIVGEEGSSRQ
jgi:hypothetical protein